MTTPVRTRFAPSPTGYLHVGGARTALFSWLYARKHNGKFVLRIEDTDRERSTEASVQAILDGMAWLGLDWDEGPFYQTQRFDRYAEVIQELLDNGHAYYCYCSKERIEAVRAEQEAQGEKPRYDGHCRGGVEPVTGVDPVVRFKSPQEGAVLIADAVKGDISINNAELDDLIIARSDGTPTYNFTVVVDDLDVQLTHVIRGDDHINNTPRQMNIMQALDAEAPVYAHLPMILGDDAKRLSKRHGAVSVLQYRDDGFLPEALLNYLVRLGWSHGDQEIFSKEEMIEHFSLEGCNRAPSAFNTEKLRWLNQHYMKNLPAEEVAKPLAWHYEHLGVSAELLATGPALDQVVTAFCERGETLVEVAEAARFLFEDFAEYDANAAKKHLRPVAREALQTLKTNLQADEWQQADDLHQIVAQTAESLALGMGKVGMPLRVAITGHGQSPDIGVTMLLLGKKRTIARIDQALTFIAQREQAAG